MPCEPQQLPCRGSGHEFTMKKRRNDMAHRDTTAAVGQPMPLPGVPGGGPGGGGPGGGYSNMGAYSQQGPDPKRQRWVARFKRGWGLAGCGLEGELGRGIG